MDLNQVNLRSVILAFLFAAGSVNLAYADIDLFEEERSCLIDNQSFQNLKNKVLDYLMNSWCSREKASLLMDLILIEKPETCVEIGVFTGSTLLPVAATLKYIGRGNVFAIDPWSNKESIKNLSETDSNRSWWSQVDMKEVLRIFSKMQREWSLESHWALLH